VTGGMSDQVDIFLVDDDELLRENLSLALALAGFTVATFASADDFLMLRPAPTAGCVITDLRLPGMSGLDLLKRLRETMPSLVVVVLTAFADVPIAVEAMKLGAADVLEKTVSIDKVTEVVRKLMAEPSAPEASSQQDAPPDRAYWLSDLSAREHEIVHLVARGHTSKQIALFLGINYRTVELHRSNILRKLGAQNTAELVSIYFSKKAE